MGGGQVTSLGGNHIFTGKAGPTPILVSRAQIQGIIFLLIVLLWNLEGHQRR